MSKTRWAVKACSLALCLCLAGCTAAPDIPQPTLDELLAEVNAEHQSIQRGELDPTPYLRTSLPQEEWPKATEYETETYSDYDPNKSLTHDEAVEDVNYLFDACYYAYGLYDYFGGHETFDAARQADQARPTAKEKQGAPAGERPVLHTGLKLFSDEAHSTGCAFLFAPGGDPSLPAPALLLHGLDLLFEVEGLLHRPVDRQQGGGQGQPDVAQNQ